MPVADRDGSTDGARARASAAAALAAGDGDGRGQPLLSRRRALGRRGRGARRAGLARGRRRRTGRLRRGPGALRARHARRDPRLRRRHRALPGQPGRARPGVAATTIPATATRCSRRSPRPGRPGFSGHRLDAVAGSRRAARPRRHADGLDAARLARDRRRRSATTAASCSSSSTSRRCATRTPANWAVWQADMQALIDLVRAEGATNVLLVDGLRFAHYLGGAPPLARPARASSATPCIPTSTSDQPDAAAVGREVRRLRARPIR